MFGNQTFFKAPGGFSGRGSEIAMDSMHLIPYIDDERLYDYAVSCAQTLRPDARTDARAEARALRRCRRERSEEHTV